MKIFLCTLLAGVAIGMLIAPEKGTVARSKVSRWWDDLNRQFNDLKGQAMEKVEDTAEAVDKRMQPYA